MIKPTWKDTTMWSQSDKDRSVPQEWTLNTGKLRIVVHHYMGCGDVWFLTCYDIGVERFDLQITDTHLAKAVAVKTVKAQLSSMSQSLANVK
jgi:hypothetical protein